jgi:hypothetical protein
MESGLVRCFRRNRSHHQGNSIFSNGGLGTDLGVGIFVADNDDGDVDSGVNDLQNFPVITQVARGPNFTNFSGTLDAAPNTSYDLEFFANDAIDPNGYGEGQTFLVALTGIMTNASGHVGFSFQHLNIGSDQRLTATATDPTNTSDFPVQSNYSTFRPDAVLTGNSVINGFIIGGTGARKWCCGPLGPPSKFGIWAS